jgi:hypothetical protein
MVKLTIYMYTLKREKQNGENQIWSTDTALPHACGFSGGKYK